MSNSTMKAVVAPPTTPTSNKGMQPIALVNSDGTPATIQRQTDQANTTAADLAALKVDFNTLLGKLRSAGILG